MWLNILHIVRASFMHVSTSMYITNTLKTFYLGEMAGMHVLPTLTENTFQDLSVL